MRKKMWVSGPRMHMMGAESAIEQTAWNMGLNLNYSNDGGWFSCTHFVDVEGPDDKISQFSNWFRREIAE